MPALYMGYPPTQFTGRTFARDQLPNLQYSSSTQLVTDSKRASAWYMVLPQ